MKFIHTADWHIGKKIHGFQLLKEQEEVYRQLVEVAVKEKVDAIVIAGDLYDRAVPPAEAVLLLNKMLMELNIVQKIPLLVVSGNHDSSTRLATGGPWYEFLNFHLVTKIEDSLKSIVLGNTQFFLLPYFEPIDARLYFGDASLTTHELAAKRVVEEMKKSFDPNYHQVLVAHLFVAGSLRTDSETEVTVGGLDQVSASVFKEFDYVALGHLHNPNASRHERIQYSGTLLKFSISEANQAKGFKLIELTDEGTLKNTFYPVESTKSLRVLTGLFDELTARDYYETQKKDDYLFIQLKDTQIIPDAMNRLREIYPNVLGMERLDKTGLLSKMGQFNKEKIQQSSPRALFEKYYQEVTGDSLSKQQTDLLTTIFAQLKIEEEDQTQ
ncbi:exonuclease SbcCD subunit D [Carnobacterium divergens]|uniref:exonuclease SbcCD subunit D n=1 Tax=Carnobacterium divergens TaxID=2748 RepID=UPI0039B0DA3B